MTGTIIDHRLVRDYLRELDVALRVLPATQARELREQITGHLDEVLPPDAGDQEIAAALSSLGPPGSLATEAMARGSGTVPGTDAPVTAGILIGRRLERVRRRTWLIAAVAVILVVIAAFRAGTFLTAGQLENGAFNYGRWWYEQDTRHNVLATANDSTQSTTPVRSGQRQGFVVEVYNGTGVAQTITGDGSGPSIGFNNPGGTDEQVAVSQGPFGAAGHDPQSYRYAPAGVVPPGQSRLVRVTWISRICLQKGESQGVTRLILRVRVGWFTRTEVIPLSDGFYLIGPSQGHCAA
jgi:hypothetical protein